MIIPWPERRTLSSVRRVGRTVPPHPRFAPASPSVSPLRLAAARHAVAFLLLTCTGMLAGEGVRAQAPSTFVRTAEVPSDGGHLTLTANRPLGPLTAENSAAISFTVKVDNSPVTASGPVGWYGLYHTRLDWTFSTPVTAGQTVTVSFTNSSEHPLVYHQTDDPVPSFSDYPVTNLSTVPGSDPLTASFEEVPAEHLGKNRAFEFLVRFSDPLGSTAHCRRRRSLYPAAGCGASSRSKAGSGGCGLIRGQSATSGSRWWAAGTAIRKARCARRTGARCRTR